MLDLQQLEILNIFLEQDLSKNQIDNLIYSFIWKELLNILLSKKQINHFNLEIPLLGILSFDLKKGEINDRLFIDKETINFKLDDYLKLNLQSVLNKEIPELLQQQLNKKLNKVIYTKKKDK